MDACNLSEALLWSVIIGGALSAAVGLGNSKLEALVAVFGSARSAYLADRQELLAARVYKEAAIDKFLKFRNLALPEQLQNFLRAAAGAADDKQ